MKSRLVMIIIFSVPYRIEWSYGTRVWTGRKGTLILNEKAYMFQLKNESTFLFIYFIRRVNLRLERYRIYQNNHRSFESLFESLNVRNNLHFIFENSFIDCNRFILKNANFCENINRKTYYFGS
jgi:hypothetical protein